MNAPDLFKRMAELSSVDELAELIKGAKVRVSQEWLMVEEQGDRLVLLNKQGQDIEHSDLNVIVEVEWPTKMAPRTQSVGVTHSVGAVLEKASEGIPNMISPEAMAAVKKP